MTWRSTSYAFSCAVYLSSAISTGNQENIEQNMLSPYEIGLATLPVKYGEQRFKQSTVYCRHHQKHILCQVPCIVDSVNFFSIKNAPDTISTVPSQARLGGLQVTKTSLSPQTFGHSPLAMHFPLASRANPTLHAQAGGLQILVQPWRPSFRLEHFSSQWFPQGLRDSFSGHSTEIVQWLNRIRRLILVRFILFYKNF